MANPYLIKAGFDIGKEIFGGIGRARDKKRYNRQLDELSAMLSKDLGTDYIDVGGIQSQIDRGIASDSAELGRDYERAGGIDIGQAQGQIATNLAGARAKSRAGLLQTNEVGKANRDAQIKSQLLDIRAAKDTGDGLLPTLGNVAGIAGNTLANIITEKEAKKREQELLQLQADTVARPFQIEEPEYSRGVSQAPTLNQASGYNFDNADMFNNPGLPAERPLSPVEEAQMEAQKIKTIMDATGLIPSGYKESKGASGAAAKPKDYASMAFDELSPIQKDFDNKLGKFLSGDNISGYDKDNKFQSRPRTKDDYTGKAPDLKAIFDATIRDNIERDLGKGAADSVFNQIAPLFGLQQQTFEMDGWAKQNLTPEELKAWEKATPEMKLKYYQQYGNK